MGHLAIYPYSNQSTFIFHVLYLLVFHMGFCVQTVFHYLRSLYTTELDENSRSIGGEKNRSSKITVELTIFLIQGLIRGLKLTISTRKI